MFIFLSLITLCTLRTDGRSIRFETAFAFKISRDCSYKNSVPNRSITRNGHGYGCFRSKVIWNYQRSGETGGYFIGAEGFRHHNGCAADILINEIHNGHTRHKTRLIVELNGSFGWFDLIACHKSFDFLSEFATEVTAHIRIDQKKGTVEEGALWYQEALPAESVLCGLLQADKPRGKAIESAELLKRVQTREDMQFGGKATTGMGFARLVTSGTGA